MPSSKRLAGGITKDTAANTSRLPDSPRASFSSWRRPACLSACSRPARSESRSLSKTIQRSLRASQSSSLQVGRRSTKEGPERCRPQEECHSAGVHAGFVTACRKVQPAGRVCRCIHVESAPAAAASLLVARRRCWTNARALTAHCARQKGVECRACSTLCKGQWQLPKQENQMMQSQAPTC